MCIYIYIERERDVHNMRQVQAHSMSDSWFCELL